MLRSSELFTCIKFAIITFKNLIQIHYGFSFFSDLAVTYYLSQEAKLWGGVHGTLQTLTEFFLEEIAYVSITKFFSTSIALAAITSSV
jgi:hypothetical protein